MSNAHKLSDATLDTGGGIYVSHILPAQGTLHWGNGPHEIAVTLHTDVEIQQYIDSLRGLAIRVEAALRRRRAVALALIGNGVTR